MRSDDKNFMAEKAIKKRDNNQQTTNRASLNQAKTKKKREKGAREKCTKPLRNIHILCVIYSLKLCNLLYRIRV